MLPGGLEDSCDRESTVEYLLTSSLSIGTSLLILAVLTSLIVLNILLGDLHLLIRILIRRPTFDHLLHKRRSPYSNSS